MIYWPRKAPADVIDYGMAWGPFLSKLGNPVDPTIIGSQWAVISGDVSVLANVINTDGRGTEVRISGGTEGSENILRNTVTLSDGQVFHEEGFLKIKAL